MTRTYEFPPAVVLGLWLNAARTGAVSATDATNALETISGQINLRDSTWAQLINVVIQTSEPVAIALPVDGDPAGVPAGTLKRIVRASGVVAIDTDLLLCQSSESDWILISEPHNVMHYDLSQARRTLTDQIANAANQLLASELVGDETEVIDALNSFRALHLPPHLSKRSTDALELAARVIIIAHGALSSSSAFHSPSVDRLRVGILEELILRSRMVLQSVVTS